VVSECLTNAVWGLIYNACCTAETKTIYQSNFSMDIRTSTLVRE
jgi:hypothetical protein